MFLNVGTGRDGGWRPLSGSATILEFLNGISGS